MDSTTKTIMSLEENMAPSPGQKGVLRISRFLNSKTILRIGNWNVRTLTQIGKIQQVEKQFKKYRLDILAMSETRFCGIGKEVLEEGSVMLFSGRGDEVRREGVGLMLTPKAAKALTEWKAVNSRLLLARFKSAQCNLSVIVCYAPVNDAQDDMKDDFYSKLQDVLDEIPQRDMKICIGDFNAKVGRNNDGVRNVMGSEGLGDNANENGAQFISFCAANRMVIGGTLFRQKDIYKYTWTSPDGKYRNQIDHIAINAERRRSLRNVRSYRSADIGSDHQLIIAEIGLKLKAPRRDLCRALRFDTEKLLEEDIRESFQIECRNRFTVLETLEEDNLTINETWGGIKAVYHETGKRVLGLKLTKRKAWITDNTWEVIKLREKQKIHVEEMHGTDEELAIERAKYWSLNSEVKRLSRRDKRKYFDDLADEADKGFECGSGIGAKNAHRIINTITSNGRRQKKIPVKDKQDRLIKSEKEERQRWAEHFCDVMNRSYEGNGLLQIPEAEEDLNLCLEEFTIFEIEYVLKKLRRWKAPGYDGITAEMILAEKNVTPRILFRLFKKMWHAEAKPDDFEIGLIIKLAKKGDLSNCNNYRGITLTSTIMKIFSMLILKRIQDTVESTLRDEQAGFRKGRSCCDQIFILRHVIQQCVEQRSPLVLAFVDYEKAFDSVHRPTLWKVLRYYGIPVKYVNLIEMLHKDSRCRVNVDGVLSGEFEVSSGVLQGNVLSPMLFALLMDYVMKMVKAGGTEGINWKDNGQKLTDLEYADDAVLFSSTSRQLQSLLDRMQDISKEVGLKINIGKTEIMRTEHADRDEITIDNQEVNEVEQFKYLGTLVANNGSLEGELNERLKKANQTMGRLSKIWQSRRLKLHTKIRLYKSLVRPVLLYGHESWYDNETVSKRFCRFENKSLRRIVGIKWQDRVRNETVREITNVPYVDEIMMRGRWRWLGHVLRREEGRLIRDAVRWKPEGSRRVGRPKSTWQRTLKKESGEEWNRLEHKATDRNEWRNLTEALCVARRWRR